MELGVCVTECWRLHSAAAVVLMKGFSYHTARTRSIRWHTVPDGTSWATIIKEAAEKWKRNIQRPCHRYIYWGGVSGASDVVRKMRPVHCTLACHGRRPGQIDKSVYALGVPMCTPRTDEVYGFSKKTRPKLELVSRKKAYCAELG